MGTRKNRKSKKFRKNRKTRSKRQRGGGKTRSLRSQWGGIGDEERCSICLEEYASDDDTRSLSCNHKFHHECVEEWLKKHDNKCPMCRKQTKKRNVQKVAAAGAGDSNRELEERRSRFEQQMNRDDRVEWNRISEQDRNDQFAQLDETRSGLGDSVPLPVYRRARERRLDPVVIHTTPDVVFQRIAERSRRMETQAQLSPEERERESSILDDMGEMEDLAEHLRIRAYNEDRHS
jgi:hypothetical protein